MMRKRNLVLGSALVAAIALVGFGQSRLEARAQAQSVMAPRFEVDPLWPQPLPNHWVLGNVIGLSVDSKDHVFIVNRRGNNTDPRLELGADTIARNFGNGAHSDMLAECCRLAPDVLEFDPSGKLVNSWGGPDTQNPPRYDWPSSDHGVNVDPEDNVWIGGNGSNDHQIIKFTHEGKFILMSGKQRAGGANSVSMDDFGGVAQIGFDATAHEGYAADGYGNKRVAVFDMATGKIKRIWGAFGNKQPGDARGQYIPNGPENQSFGNPVHCAMVSNDKLVYVCDRTNDRIQVFHTDGSYVGEIYYNPYTGGDGSVWEIAFSKDADQKYMYVADGADEKVLVMDRKAMKVLTTFGEGGRQPGQFYATHSIFTDSKGNIYTTETYDGKRVQKFVYRGLAPVTKMDQGTVWPTRTTAAAAPAAAKPAGAP